MSLYPLKFRPRFVEKIWGGRKIETVLGKPLPPDKQIGESWELYDFPPGVVETTKNWVSSEVANGPLAGRSLHSLVSEFGTSLTGSAALAGASGQFPILIKFLDAREDLSVQVHPDEEFAASHPGAHLKSEAWYVLEHDPGARLFKGLSPGTSRESFRSAIDGGRVEHHLKAIPAAPGQCFYLPSGTVHALGAGMLVAEVQTPSDTTFRVYDFNRVDPSTGTTRELHVEQAMQCIDFKAIEKPDSPPPAAGGRLPALSRLVDCPYFQIHQVRSRKGTRQPLQSTEPLVWIMLEGQAEVKVGSSIEPTQFGKGETILLPASMQSPTLTTMADSVWLEVAFPTRAAAAR